MKTKTYWEVYWWITWPPPKEWVESGVFRDYAKARAYVALLKKRGEKAKIVKRTKKVTIL